MAKSLKEKLAAQLANNMAAHNAGGQDAVFDAGKDYKKIHLELIDPNPYQPRIVFDSKEIEDLAASIQSTGLLQPITVRSVGERYQIVAGERRFRAHRLLNKRTVEAIVVAISDAEMATLALAENIAREDLSDFEIAKGIQTIQDQFPTKTSLAASLGIIREDLYTYLAFDELPSFVIEKLEANPRLVSRTLAKELKKVIRDKDGTEAVLEAVRKAIELLEVNQLNANAVIDFVHRSLRGRLHAEQAHEPYHLVRAGKKVGSIARDSRNLVVKFKRAALNVDQERRLVEFLDKLAAETV